MKAADLKRVWSERERLLAASRPIASGLRGMGKGVLTPEELSTAIGGQDAENPGNQVTVVIIKEGGYCFTAETLVQTPAGPMPIHTLEKGDHVLTFDMAAGRVCEGRVAGLDAHDVTTPLVTLATGGERIVTTPKHRFHGAEGWQAAEALRGHGIDLRQKARPVVLVGAHPAQKVQVYNVRVEEHGSYFVGRTGLWVRDH